MQMTVFSFLEYIPPHDEPPLQVIFSPIPRIVTFEFVKPIKPKYFARASSS